MTNCSYKSNDISVQNDKTLKYKDNKNNNTEANSTIML